MSILDSRDEESKSETQNTGWRDKESHSESQNTLFGALANHRRRYTLYACNSAENGELSLSEVAEQVAAWEYGKPISEITSDERKRVYTSLQQHHLSTLEEAELIELDGDRIRLTEKAEEMELYLDIVPQGTIPWSAYYLALAAIGGAAILIVQFLTVPDWLTIGTIAVALILVMAISAVAHLIDTRGHHLDAAEVREVQMK